MFERQSQPLRQCTMLVDVALTAAMLPAGVLAPRAFRGPAQFAAAHIVLLSIIAPLRVFLLTFFGAYKSPPAASLLDLV
jgi:hypothetical protein